MSADALMVLWLDYKGKCEECIVNGRAALADDDLLGLRVCTKLATGYAAAMEEIRTFMLVKGYVFKV